MSLLALTTTMVFLAAGDTTTVQPDVTWLQYGFVGLVAGGGLTFGLRTHRRVVKDCDGLSAEVRRLQTDHAAELSRVRDEHAAELTRVRDAHAGELKAINTSIQDRIVPLLTDTVRVMGEVTQVTRERR